MYDEKELETLVNDLRPHYARVVELVSAIDGPFKNLFEAGIFVSSVATAKILSLDKTDGPAAADEFNHAWINYVVSSYDIDGESPSKNTVVSRLQELFPRYRTLFLNAVDPSKRDKAQDHAVQLAWEIFSNCTGKEKPESRDGFTKLVATSDEFVVVGTRVLNAIEG